MRPEQAPALSGLLFQQTAQTMWHIIGVEAQQQAGFVPVHDVLNRRSAAIGRREMNIKRRFHFARMRLGAAGSRVAGSRHQSRLQRAGAATVLDGSQRDHAVGYAGAAEPGGRAGLCLVGRPIVAR